MSALRERYGRVRDRLRERAAALRHEVRVLVLALRDPRTPWYAKAVAGLTVALAASPVDPIPDVVPVLGYLDDLVLVPLGVLLARRAVPEAVLADARERADEEPADAGGVGWLGALLVLAAWVLAAYLVLAVVLPLIGW